MRVLITGGTGFVGSHTVKAVTEAGHQVRLLVRDPGRMRPALGPLGIPEDPDHVTGDITDPVAVGRAMSGCDAVIHAASVYSTDARQRHAIRNTNLAGARTVLGLATMNGLDPIVHVSSVVALLPSPKRIITEDTPAGGSRWSGPYARSKAEQEAYARRLQADGARLVIAYPGAVWGPHDPHDGESTVFARRGARGLAPLLPSVGFPMVDVRDLATALAAMLVPGRGSRRYVLGGNYITVAQTMKSVYDAAGVRRLRIPIPATLAQAAGFAASRVQPWVPFRLPIEEGVTWFLRCDVRTDNSVAVRELGASFRPSAITIADQIAWQKAEGRL